MRDSRGGNVVRPQTFLALLLVVVLAVVLAVTHAPLWVSAIAVGVGVSLAFRLERHETGC